MVAKAPSPLRKWRATFADRLASGLRVPVAVSWYRLVTDFNRPVAADDVSQRGSRQRITERCPACTPNLVEWTYVDPMARSTAPSALACVERAFDDFEDRDIGGWFGERVAAGPTRL